MNYDGILPWIDEDIGARQSVLETMATDTNIHPSWASNLTSANGTFLGELRGIVQVKLQLRGLFVTTETIPTLLSSMPEALARRKFAYGLIQTLRPNCA